MRNRIWDLRRRPSAASSRSGVTAALMRWMEALLLLLIAIQAARLVWAMLTPLGMLGSWQARAPGSLPMAARTALFQSFDPFTRGTQGDAPRGPVTGLSLQLFGTRINEGSGQGSAIIATPDGVQSSFVAGDQILPGVTLKDIAYDHVVIDRGGKAETLFLDQSGGMEDGGSASAPPTANPGGPPPPPSITSSGQLTPTMIQRDIRFAPRMDGGRISGLFVAPQGGGDGFARAGFQQGDVITQVNGRPITSGGDIQALQAQLRPGVRLSLMIERGAATVPLAITPSGEQ